MRRLGPLLLLCFTVLCALAPAVQADDPALELRWHLDQSSAGAGTPDSSGKNRPGTNVAIGSGRFTGGVSGAAVTMSGANQGTFPNAAVVSVVAWVRSNGAPVSSGNEAWIVSAGGDGLDDLSGCRLVDYGLRVAPDGTLTFAAQRADDSYAESAGVGPLPIWDGLWHAVTGTYDGTEVELFVDGQAIGSPTPYAAGIAYESGPVHLRAGASCERDGEFDVYTGDYDEVRAYSKALTPAEVSWLHGSVGGQMPRVLPVPPAAEAVSLRHPLDTQSGGTTPDTSGNGLGGIEVVANSVAGRFGQAFDTNLNGGGYRVNENVRLSPQRFTAIAWAKHSGSVPVFQTIFGKGGESCSNSSWAIRTQGDGSLSFFANLFTPTGGQTAVQTSSVPNAQIWNGQWRAIAATYARGTAKLYVDGALQSTVTAPAAAIGPGGAEELDYSRFTERRAAVGRYPANGCAIGRFPGSIDEVRLYDRVLTDAQIATLHDGAATSPPADPAPPATTTPAPGPNPVFTDFTAVNGEATGTLGGISVRFAGPEVNSVANGSIVNGTGTYFSAPAFSPELATSDVIQATAGAEEYAHLIEFGSPVTDPILHIGSLASRIAFPAGTRIARDDGDGRFGVDENVIEGSAGGGGATTDGNGTVRIIGTFSSLSFTTTSSSSNDPILYQVGRSQPTAPSDLPTIWWKLDSFTGDPNGAAQTPDASGNGNTGTATIFQPIVTGRFGNAMRLHNGFNGLGTGIRLPDSPAFETPNVSTLIWVRRLGAPAQSAPILSYGDDCAGGGWRLNVEANGAVRFRASTQTGEETSDPIPEDAVWDGAWHAIGVTYDGAAARIYLDGQRVVSGRGDASRSGPLAYPPGNNVGFAVGAPSQGSCSNTHPDIDVDDARLYGRALTEAEVAHLSSPFHVVSPALPVQTEPAAEPALRHHLDAIDDTSGPQGPNGVRDDSGHGLHGSDVRGVQTAGRFAGALAPESPTAAGYVVRGRSSFVEPQALTAFAWVKGTGPQNGTVVGKSFGTCDLSYGIEAAGGLRATAAGVSTSAVAAAEIWDGEWHAVAVAAGAGSLTLWVDGEAAATTPLGGPVAYDSRPFEVGRQASCPADTPFQGSVDEVRLYERVLSAQEIAYLQAPTFTTPPDLPVGPIPTPTATPEPTVTGTPIPTPVAEPEPGLAVKWHLEKREDYEGEPFDQKVFDFSGNGRHGTPGLGGFVAGGRFGNAFAVPTEAAAGPVGVGSQGTAPIEPNQLTTLAWVRSATASNGQVILSYSADCGLGAYGLLVQQNSNALQRGLSFYVDTVDRLVVAGPVFGDVFDGQWHAVAGTYDGSKVQLYVDGLPAGDPVNATGAIKYTGAGRALRAGGPVTGPCDNPPFRGAVDEVRVYDRALNGEELAYLQAGYHRRPPRLPIPAGPRNLTRPGITGVPKVGTQLTCSPGRWTGATRFEYLWERAPRSTTVDGDAAWVTIDGANGQQYVPTATDASSRVRCREIAFDEATSEEAVSRSLRVDTDIPTNSTAPAVVTQDPSQPPRSGRVLVCEEGVWTGGPAASDFSYRWLREGTTITGATSRTYTPSPSRNSAGIFLDLADGNHDLSCEVIARNDVGASVPVVSVRRFVIDDRPGIRNSESGPKVTLGPADDGSQNPLRRTATCDKGIWVDAYADHPETAAPSGFDYTYQWFRRNDGEGEAQGVPIAGATGPQLKITADQLGRYVFCKVTARNPLGETTVSSQINTFIPLPVPTKTATFETVFRDNKNDPINMTAVDVAYRQAVSDYAKGLFTQELDSLKTSCAEGQQRIRAELAALPSQRQQESPATPAQRLRALLIPDEVPTETGPAINFNDKERCWIILRDPTRLVVTDKGVLWTKRNRNYPQTRGGCDPAASSAPFLCTDIGIRIQPVSGSTALALKDPALQQRLDSGTPERILYDIDGNGGTDISCPGSSPVLRAQLIEGRYPVNVVIVERGSASTGLFSGVSRAASPVFFPNRDIGRNPGSLRPNLPKWCRTSMVPPPDPKVGPCTGAATIGSVQLQGNMCPINVRAIPSSQTKGLPQQLQDVIARAAAAVNAQEFNAEKLLPGYNPGTRVASLTDPVFRAGAVDSQIFAAANNTAATIGNLDLAREYARTNGSPVEQAINAQFAQGKSLLNEKASFALDQIYAVNAVGSAGNNGVGGIPGTLKVNGVTINPGGKGLTTIIAPSDVSQGVKDYASKQMEIFSPEARSALGELPLTTDPEEFKAKIEEKITAKKDEILKQGINYTAERFKGLLDKLKFPFKLTGSDVKVKLNDNGTATLEATAAVPGLTTAYPSPGGSGSGDKAGGPITTLIRLTGDLNGNIQLQDVRLRVSKAYLIGVQLEKLDIAYNNERGLNVGGLITFPLSGGEGIGIENFRLGTDGEFLGTQVFYAAGVGKGIQVAPGVFLTEIGGGFSTKPYEISGRAAVSAGLPSSGSGCPTIGIKGGVNFHWSPTPLFMNVKGDVVLVCIPFANFDFYADSTGWVKASAKWFFNVPHIANLNASIDGQLKTTDVRLDANGQVVAGRRLPWQIAATGTAEFPDFPIPDVALKGVLSSLGVAACGSVRIKPPLLPSFRLAAGGAVRFPNGIPPITYVELLANFRAFTGCDLSAYLPLGSTRVARQLDAPQVFTLSKGAQVLSFEGAGAAPRVKLTSPDGKTYDFSDADAEDGKLIDDAYGAVIAEEDRSVVILPYAKAGSWRVETAAGTTPVARIQRAKVLDDPKIKAKVTGKGAGRTLSYDIERIAGQAVTFVETANSGHQVIGTVKNGGKGKLRYTLGETRSPKRTITALVSQDGFPRTQLAVARYVAANPRLAAPKVKLRRKGTSAVASFKPVAGAARYDVRASFADGRDLLFEPAGKKPTVTLAGVGKKGAVTVRAIAYSISGRASRTGVARLKAARSKPKPRPQKPKPDKKKGAKRKRAK